MKPRERLNVYFHMDKYVYKLFHVVNIGKTYEKPEFKFSGMGDITIHHKKVISESGVISDDDTRLVC